MKWPIVIGCLIVWAVLLIVFEEQEEEAPRRIVLASTTAPPPPPPLPSPPPLHWIVPDLHDGTRSELASTLSALGAASVVMANLKPCAKMQEAVTAMRGVRCAERDELPQALRNYVVHQHHFSNDDVLELFNATQRDERSPFYRADAYVCSFTLAPCEALMALNASVVMLAAHRFSLSHCSAAAFLRDIEHVQVCDALDNCIVACSNRYDCDYIRYYAGVVPLFVDCGAFFYAGAHRGLVPKPAIAAPEILLGPLQRVLMPRAWQAALDAANQAAGAPFSFVPVKRKYPRFTLAQIAAHRAIVALPYSSSAVGLVECQALAVPLFAPTPEFLAQLHAFNDRWQLDATRYCAAFDGSLPARHARAPADMPSPDTRVGDFDSNASLYWTRRMDIYDERQFPSVTYFASWPELIEQLQRADFQQLSRRQMRENVLRERRLNETWRQRIFPFMTKKKPIRLDEIDRHWMLDDE